MEDDKSEADEIAEGWRTGERNGSEKSVEIAEKYLEFFIGREEVY